MMIFNPRSDFCNLGTSHLCLLCKKTRNKQSLFCYARRNSIVGILNVFLNTLVQFYHYQHYKSSLAFLPFLPNYMHPIYIFLHIVKINVRKINVSIWFAKINIRAKFLELRKIDKDKNVLDK